MGKAENNSGYSNYIKRREQNGGLQAHIDMTSYLYRGSKITVDFALDTSTSVKQGVSIHLTHETGDRYGLVMLFFNFLLSAY